MSRCLFHVGDVFAHMANIPDSSVDLIVTSPPFLALRSYLPADHPDKHLEIGSEPTPAAYLTTLLALTREWRRILAPHGSIAIELGDTYSGGWVGESTPEDERANAAGGPRLQDRRRNSHAKRNKLRESNLRGWPLPKSLCLIPSSYAWALAYGHNPFDPTDVIEPWRIRNLIVWHRPNPPVGQLGDKVRPSTSYITTASTSAQRWFDLDAERVTPKSTYAPSNVDMAKREAVVGVNGYGHMSQVIASNPAGAPPLDCWIDGDVWTIPTAPYKGAHYATYPTALPRRLINLMCPREVCTVCGEPRRRIVGEAEYVNARSGEVVDKAAWTDPELLRQGAIGRDNGSLRTAPTLGWTDCHHNTWRRGQVLDPFAGSGTTAVAASESGRDSILIDLDERNLHLARERIGLFLEEATQ